MKSKSLILMVLSLGFGLVAAIGINQIMKSSQASAKAPVQKVGPVVVSAGDLSVYDLFSEENVQIENWPVSIIPPDAITSLEEIIDHATKVRMSKGMPVIKTALVHKTDIRKLHVPEGYKVVAVRAGSDQTMGNLLQPGHRVDVIGIFKQRDPRTNRTTQFSSTFLKALQVFSINSKTNASDEGDSGGRAGATIVGLIVTEKQSEALVYAQETGTIKLVLRGPDAVADDSVDEDFQKIMNGTYGADTNTENEVKTINRTHEMQIFIGNDVKNKTFNSNGTMKPEFAPHIRQPNHTPPRMAAPSRESAANSNGSERESDSAGNDRNIDDDQYRGE